MMNIYKTTTKRICAFYSRREVFNDENGCLFGIEGSCRTNELSKMTTEDAGILNDKLIVTSANRTEDCFHKEQKNVRFSSALFISSLNYFEVKLIIFQSTCIQVNA